MSYQLLDVDHQDRPVSDHLKAMADGRYGLPEFQRTFVWDNDRILKLWESLYEGYPVG